MKIFSSAPIPMDFTQHSQILGPKCAYSDFQAKHSCLCHKVYRHFKTNISTTINTSMSIYDWPNSSTVLFHFFLLLLSMCVGLCVCYPCDFLGPKHIFSSNDYCYIQAGWSFKCFLIYVAWCSVNTFHTLLIHSIIAYQSVACLSLVLFFHLQSPPYGRRPCFSIFFVCIFSLVSDLYENVVARESLVGMLSHLKKDIMCIARKNADACQGDSGGPVLWVNPETGQYEQVALVQSKILARNSSFRHCLSCIIPDLLKRQNLFL